MKNWFLQLKETTQILLIIIVLAFVLAVSFAEARMMFFSLVTKIVEVVCQSGYGLSE